MNTEMKEAIKKAHLFQWQVAQQIGVSEITLMRWFRSPLSEEKSKKIMQAIMELKAGEQNDRNPENANN